MHGDQGRGRRVAVSLGQHGALGVARSVQVLRPFDFRKSFELLPTDGGKGQARLACQALQSFVVFRSGNGFFVEGYAAGLEQGPARIARSALGGRVKGHRVFGCHLPQFKWQIAAPGVVR